MIEDLGLPARDLAAADPAPALRTEDQGAMGLGLAIEGLAPGPAIEDQAATDPDEVGRAPVPGTEVQIAMGPVTADVTNLKTEDRDVTGPPIGADAGREIPHRGRAGGPGVRPRARGVGRDGSDLRPGATDATEGEAQILAALRRRAEASTTWIGSLTKFCGSWNPCAARFGGDSFSR